MALARRTIETKTVGRTLAHDSAVLHVQGAARIQEGQAASSRANRVNVDHGQAKGHVVTVG